MLLQIIFLVGYWKISTFHSWVVLEIAIGSASAFKRPSLTGIK